LEWETEIPFEEAKALLQLPVGQQIEQIRHIIPNGDLVFELYHFLIPKNNLILVEVELPEENTPFHRPEWLGKRGNGQSNIS